MLDKQYFDNVSSQIIWFLKHSLIYYHYVVITMSKLLHGNLQVFVQKKSANTILAPKTLYCDAGGLHLNYNESVLEKNNYF